MADVDDVDALAEAEIYAAYGRNKEAREILQEALQRDPSREDIREKLAKLPSTNTRMPPQTEELMRFFPGIFLGSVGYVVIEVAQHAMVRNAGIVLVTVGAVMILLTIKRFSERGRKPPGKG